MTLNFTDAILVKTSGGSIVKTNTVEDIIDIVDVEYPKCWESTPFTFNATSGTYIPNFITGYPFNGVIFGFTTAAIGNRAEAGIVLAAGNYSLGVVGLEQNNQGIIKWQLDGNDIITGQDWYTAGSTWNAMKTGSLSIASGGYHKLAFEVTGKNAASSSYYSGISYVWIKSSLY